MKKDMKNKLQTDLTKYKRILKQHQKSWDNNTRLSGDYLFPTMEELKTEIDTVGILVLYISSLLGVE